MQVSPALPVGKRIPAENLRSVILKAVAKPWRAARQLLVAHAPAAIVGAVGTDPFKTMHFKIVGFLAPTIIILICLPLDLFIDY